LKQLIYSLSICSDGAVPVHQKTYPGNRNDDTTHIETWETLRNIYGDTSFLYVADSKLCSTAQLSHIVSQKGRAITIVPESFTEVHAFKDSLRRRYKSKQEIWRRPKPNNSTEMEYYSVFRGTYVTKQSGYRLHWIHSSEKRQRDQASRLQRLRKAEEALMELSGKINIRRLKTKDAIQRKIDAILERYRIEPYIHIKIGVACEERRAKLERGRPSPDPEYKRIITRVFTLGWSRNITRLRQEAQIDGIFPLLCTDHSLSAKEVLQAYKYQPRLEKRFNQLKQIHHGAPLLFKKLERIEATMFAFFIALTIQALIERQVRHQMADREIPAIALYPEDRDASHPTTAKLMGIFSEVSTYKLFSSSDETKEFRDDLTEVQQTVLDLLNIPENSYWNRKQIN
jgi:transposase